MYFNKRAFFIETFEQLQALVTSYYKTWQHITPTETKKLRNLTIREQQKLISENQFYKL